MDHSIPPATEFSEGEWNKLYRIMGGHIFFQTLSAAVRFDLFGLLNKHGPLTCSQIAEKLKIEEMPARILLLGCTSLELLQRSHSKYANSDLADRLLVRGAPGNIIPVIEWQHFINYRAMYWFYESIKANENVGLKEFDGDEGTLYERLVHTPELEKVFQDAMAVISVQANDLFAQHADFSNVRHVVDVGGGNGTNLITLLSRNDHLRGTVFDSPTVCKIAEENFKQAGLESRLGSFTGSCFHDAFPDDADCFLFSHFLTIWSEQENRDLLRKTFDALPQGGRAVVFNMMQSDSRDGPLTAAWGSPYFLALATGKGMLYCWDEYETWMKDAGFAMVERHQLPRDHGVITGIKA